jgi:hypothetical protein
MAWGSALVVFSGPASIIQLLIQSSGQLGNVDCNEMPWRTATGKKAGPGPGRWHADGYTLSVNLYRRTAGDLLIVQIGLMPRPGTRMLLDFGPASLGQNGTRGKEVRSKEKAIVEQIFQLSAGNAQKNVAP